ncbi:MAG TPA: DUF2905 domain-containing protein [Cyclobacteriaceae bacterium]
MMKMGKLFIISGVILIVVGVIITLLPKNSVIGRLPGDIIIERENFKFYIPVTTGIIISIILTIILYVISRFR